MDAENGWHRRHVQRVYEKREEERKRREIERRYYLHSVCATFFFF